MLIISSNLDAFLPKLQFMKMLTLSIIPRNSVEKQTDLVFLRLQIDSLWLATATVVVASTGHKESPEGVIALERESDSCELLGEIAST